jgi:uncharacterized protein
MEKLFQTAPFEPARGLSSPHAQTVIASLFRPRNSPNLIRERWDTPDGDFVDVDVLPADRGAPHLLVLHGLEGSSSAGYVLAIMREAQARGMGGFALNFRSCSGEMNRLARSYHSGETQDAEFVVDKIRQRITGPLCGVGFSLGGNVLLRLLEETGAASRLEAAVAVSVPFDLSACADSLDAKGFWATIYRARFMRTLKRKALEKVLVHPGILDEGRLRQARTLREFDDCVTAPLHGFSGASDYYERCSSGPHLGAIRKPTLLIISTDDPFIPERAIPFAQVAANPCLSLLATRGGGHVGFIEGNWRRRSFWAEKVALSFIDHSLSARVPS